MDLDLCCNSAAANVGQVRDRAKMRLPPRPLEVLMVLNALTSHRTLAPPRLWAVNSGGEKETRKKIPVEVAYQPFLPFFRINPSHTQRNPRVPCFTAMNSSPRSLLDPGLRGYPSRSPNSNSTPAEPTTRARDPLINAARGKRPISPSRSRSTTEGAHDFETISNPRAR